MCCLGKWERGGGKVRIRVQSHINCYDGLQDVDRKQMLHIFPHGIDTLHPLHNVLT